jgi:2-polyprenyl-3-methyl-5-hydroxy-6-metoxy-1,4-benzoquinol methylase
VLDLGCASGRLGEALKGRGIASEVDGVELSETAAAEARGRLDRVWVADLADFDWAETADDYDVIIAADVLEHLADPWRTLRDLRHRLAPDGTIIASIPNIRYWKVIWDLLVRGEFRYVDEGILDRTHLRFFTRASIRRLFADSGYTIDHLAPNPIDRPRLRGAIMAAAGDLAHVQYHVVARAADDARGR